MGERTIGSGRRGSVLFTRWISKDECQRRSTDLEVLGWREDLECAEREVRELLDEQVKKVEDAGGTVAGVHFREERPAEEIVALAEELRVGLMVVGSRGRGGIRRVLGGFLPAGSPIGSSVTRCPVLVVGAEARVADIASGALTGSPAGMLLTEALRNPYGR
jgi:nucleotide-binding universal stress UspA family protein